MLKRARVKAKSLLNRLSGISIGLTGVGVSWRPKEAERDIVRSLIIFLEDRRALVVDRHREHSEHLALSLIEIRKVLTECLQKLGDDSRANDPLRLMRAACSKFLTKQDGENGHFPHFNYYEELGALRALFGQQIAILGYLYNVDIGEHLASILPPEKE